MHNCKQDTSNEEEEGSQSKLTIDEAYPSVSTDNMVKKIFAFSNIYFKIYDKGYVIKLPSRIYFKSN